jgi:hypothetical protein
MLRLLVVVLAIIDILLQRRGPGNVIDLLNGVSIGLQSSKELIEAETRLSSNVDNAGGVVRRVESSGNDNPHDIV